MTELLYWQVVAGFAGFVAILAVVVMAGVIFADHATYRPIYRRGRS